MKRQILNLTIISLSFVMLLSLASAKEATGNLVGGTEDCCQYYYCSVSSAACSIIHTGCGGNGEGIAYSTGANNYEYSSETYNPCTGSSSCEGANMTDYTCTSC